MSERVCKVPLVELLKRVPLDLREELKEGEYSYRSISVGAYCHRAAEIIAALESHNAKLAGELAFHKDREQYFAKLLGVADGGQYRADWDGKIKNLMDDLSAARAEIARLAKDRDEKQALNEYFRDTVGECHMMISRNTSEYQIRKEWDPTDLPPRLQGVMKRAENAEAEIARLKAANGLWEAQKRYYDLLVMPCSCSGTSNEKGSEIRWSVSCKEFCKASLHLDALTKADRGEGK